MNHRELGDTYLTLLEAIEQTALSEAEVVLHSEEVWRSVKDILGISRYVKTLKGMQLQTRFA